MKSKSLILSILIMVTVGSVCSIHASQQPITTKDQALYVIQRLIDNNKKNQEDIVQQKGEILKAKTDLETEHQTRLKAEDTAKKESERADTEFKRANQWEHRTEVIVELFAIAFSFWIGTMMSGNLMREFPTPWNLIAIAVVYLCTFSFGMWITNRFIDTIGKVVPTVPSWHQVQGWVHQSVRDAKDAVK